MFTDLTFTYQNYGKNKNDFYHEAEFQLKSVY